MGLKYTPNHPLIPAKAGIQWDISLDSRLRRSEQILEVISYLLMLVKGKEQHAHHSRLIALMVN